MAKVKGKLKRKVRREAIQAAFRLAKRDEVVDENTIAEEIAAGGAFAAGELEAWDWDAIIEFIKKLIPLIKLILALFGL